MIVIELLKKKQRIHAYGARSAYADTWTAADGCVDTPNRKKLSRGTKKTRVSVVRFTSCLIQSGSECENVSSE